MTTRRFLLLLSAALLAITGAVYLSSLRHLDRDPRGQALLPGLETQLDAVTEIRLRKASPGTTVTLRRAAPGRWTVAERGDYPADVSKIRKLLLELAAAKIVEEKTANPANYAILGVQDPTDAAAGAELTIVEAATSRALVVGKAAASGSFVRRGGERQSFAVEPPISVETGVHDWIDQTFLSIATDKIQSIRTHLADGTSYSIVRQSPAKQTGTALPGTAAPGAAPPAAFVLESTQPGREAADPATLAPAPTTFSGVAADDVAAAGSIDFSTASTCEIKLIDGSSYTLTGTAAGEKYWLTVTASDDKALTARARNRAFEVASYRYAAIFRPLEQLLKPKPATAKPASAPKKAAGVR